MGCRKKAPGGPSAHRRNFPPVETDLQAMHTLKLLKTLRWPIVGKAALIAVAIPVAVALVKPIAKKVREQTKKD